MLSNLLSDLSSKINTHIIGRPSLTGHAGNNITLAFRACVPDNIFGCFLKNHPRRPLRIGLLLKIQLPYLRNILMQQLFTVPTLCAYLSISRATLYRLIKQGEIEPIHIGSLTRFKPSEVERFIKEKQHQSRISEVGF